MSEERRPEIELALADLERQLNIAYGTRRWPDGVSWAVANLKRAVRGEPRISHKARRAYRG
jgi:hypothetical protein